MKQIVYVASPESQQIHTWQLDEQGVLTLLQTVNVPGQAQPMVIHPNKSHLYVGVRPACGIISYRIAADGTLQDASLAPLPAGPTHLATDLQGRYIFSASYSGNCVSVSPIGHDGVATAPIQQLDGFAAPHSANIDPTNQRLWVPCLKADHIRLFNVDQAGNLTPHHQAEIATAAGAGPRHMAFHPNGKFAYCINELDGTITMFSIHNHSDHYCTPEQTLDLMPSNFTGTRWAADLHLTPNGRFLYASDRIASVLAMFSIDEHSGNMTLIGHHATEQQPRGFNIDHCGRFLISAGQKSNHIAVCEINAQNGTLTTLARYPVGQGPMWVSILALYTRRRLAAS